LFINILENTQAIEIKRNSEVSCSALGIAVEMLVRQRTSIATHSPTRRGTPKIWIFQKAFNFLSTYKAYTKHIKNRGFKAEKI
jgi:hypothetical protein